VLDEVDNPKITTKRTSDGTQVLIGGKSAFLVTRADIDASIGETTQNVARESARRLAAVLEERHQQRSPRYLALASAYALGGTALYALMLWLLARARSALERRVLAARALERTLGGVPTVSVHQLLALTKRIVAMLAWLAGFAMTVGWLTFVLERFPYSRPWGERLEANLLEIAVHMLRAAGNALPGLIVVVLIASSARGVLRLGSLFFDRVEQGQARLSWVDADTAPPTRRIFALVVGLFALAMAYPYLPGAESDAFKGLSVLFGVMVSLGGSSLFGQAAHGLTLMYSRSLRRGDHVRIGDSEGTIVDIGMFATRLRTGLGDEIMLPSSTVMATTTRNYSRTAPGKGYFVDTGVTIGYATPWRQVHAMLLEAADQAPGIASEPAPFVRQTALGDFYIAYRLVAYSQAEHARQRAEVLSDLHCRIQDIFNRHGVQIMSPHYVYDPVAPQVVSPNDWYAAPAAPTVPAAPEASASGAGARDE